MVNKIEELTPFQQSLKEVMSTTDGRIVILSLLSRTNAYRPIYEPDSNSMYYATGKQSLGLELLNELLSIDINLYTFALKEYNKIVNSKLNNQSNSSKK